MCCRSPAAAAPAAGRPAQPVRIHPGPAGGKTGSLPRDIDAAALALLREQRWPGNLRQLRNTLEQAVAMTDGDTLGAAELRPFLPDPTRPRRLRATLATRWPPPSGR